MDALAAAKGAGVARMAVGAALIVAPRPLARSWLGDAADRPEIDVVVRALGVRDLFMGFLTLHVADRKGVGARTVEAWGVMDAVDLTATLAARRHLPASSGLTIALAGAGAVSNLVLGRLLPR